MTITHLITSFGHAEEANICFVPWFHDAQNFQSPKQALTNFFDDLKKIYLNEEKRKDCGHARPKNASYCPECGNFLNPEEDMGEAIAYWFRQLCLDKSHKSVVLFGSDIGMTGWQPAELPDILMTPKPQIVLVYETDLLFDAYVEGRALQDATMLEEGFWQVCYYN